MPAKRSWFGKVRIEFHQIAVGFRVAGDGASEPRDDAEGIGVVDAVEHRHVDGGEFQAEEAPAVLQHAVGLGERRSMRGTLRMPKAIV